jgi:hypothetical protein
VIRDFLLQQAAEDLGVAADVIPVTEPS